METDESGRDTFSAYIPKPIRRSQLFNAITNLLSTGEAAAPSPATERKLNPELADRLPRKILVDEDNTTNQLLMLRALQKMGYVADTAGNGREALDALKRQHYDVVFMDVEMPEMDGIEATKAIVATWPAQERPFIVGTTAYALESDARECLEAGMNAYLSKPIKLEELQQILRDSGEHGSAHTEPVIPPTAAASVVDLERVKEVLRMDAQQQADLLSHLIDLYLKDESTHPTGSLKHRLARSLFLYALCNGWLREGTTVVEASSGSTAVSSSPRRNTAANFRRGRCRRQRLAAHAHR